MERWRDKVAVVTGAASGIGAAITASLVHHGLQVVGLDVQEDRLKKMAGQISRSGEPGRLYPVKTDLRKEEDILEAFRWTDQELGGVDVLVNNAGVFYIDFLAEGKTDQWRDMLEVNTLAPAICTREYLNIMNRKNNQNGHIFITCSVMGHQADFPGMSVYCASKFGVRAISMVLRRELAQKNSTIKVTTISPGAVDTEMLKSLNTDGMVKLDPSDVAGVVVSALSATEKTQFCEVVVAPVPTRIAPY